MAAQRCMPISVGRRAGALVLAVVLLASSACANDTDDASDASAKEGAAEPGGATALRLIAARTPRLDLPRYRTRGVYPQVADGDGDLSAVNAALTAAVRSHVRETARRFGRVDRESPPPHSVGNSGRYETSIDRELTSASTEVVSVLVPVLALRPGGNAGRTWLSATVRVPSGVPVSVTRLFRKGSGLTAVAEAARSRILATSRCVREGIEDPVVGPINRKGFAPIARNYRYFALTARGLAIGFPTGSIGATSCGRVVTVVPYDVLRPHLSETGRALVAGVRAPTR